MLGMQLEAGQALIYLGQLLGLLALGILLTAPLTSAASSEASEACGTSGEHEVRLFDLKWALEQRLAPTLRLPTVPGAQNRAYEGAAALEAAETACWLMEKRAGRPDCLRELHRFYWLITAQNQSLREDFRRDQAWQEVIPAFGGAKVLALDVRGLERQTFYPSLLKAMNAHPSWKETFGSLSMRQLFRQQPDSPRKGRLRKFDAEMIDHLVQQHREMSRRGSDSSDSLTPAEHGESSEEGSQRNSEGDERTVRKGQKLGRDSDDRNLRRDQRRRELDSTHSHEESSVFAKKRASGRKESRSDMEPVRKKPSTSNKAKTSANEQVRSAENIKKARRRRKHTTDSVKKAHSTHANHKKGGTEKTAEHAVKKARAEHPTVAKRLFAPEGTAQECPIKALKERRHDLSRAESTAINCYWEYQDKFLVFLETIYTLAMQYWVGEETSKTFKINFVYWSHRVNLMLGLFSYAINQSDAHLFFKFTSMQERRTALNGFMHVYRKRLASLLENWKTNPFLWLFSSFLLAMGENEHSLSSPLKPIRDDDVDVWDEAYENSCLARLYQKFDDVGLTMVLMYMASPELIRKGKEYLSPKNCLGSLREAISKRNMVAYRKALMNIDELSKMAMEHYMTSQASWKRRSPQKHHDDESHETDDSERTESDENSLYSYGDEDRDFMSLRSSIPTRKH